MKALSDPVVVVVVAVASAGHCFRRMEKTVPKRDQMKMLVVALSSLLQS